MSRLAPDGESLRRIGEVITSLICNETTERRGVVHDTFVIERACLAAPERVFAALADPEARRGWVADSPAHDVVSFEMDFRVGGRAQANCRFRTGEPFEGAILAHDGTYLDITFGRRIVEASTTTLAGRRIAASLVTLTLTPTARETTLTCTHQGAFFDGAGDPRRYEAAWRTRLDQLTKALAHQALARSCSVAA